MTARPRSAAALVLGLALALFARVAMADPPAQTAIPKLDGHVVDTSHVLTADQVLDLDRGLEQFRLQHGNAIVVFVFPTVGTETISDVAYRAFNTWGVGDKGKDDGVLLAIATVDRKIRIETGRGVEGALPDLKANDIIRGQIGPQLKQGNYYQGVVVGTQAIEKALLAAPEAGGDKVASKPAASLSTGGLLAIIGGIVFVLLIGVGCVVSPGFRSGTWTVLKVLGFILDILAAFAGSSGSSSGSSSRGSSGSSSGGGSGYSGGGGTSGGGGSDDSY